IRDDLVTGVQTCALPICTYSLRIPIIPSIRSEYVRQSVPKWTKIKQELFASIYRASCQIFVEFTSCESPHPAGRRQSKSHRQFVRLSRSARLRDGCSSRRRGGSRTGVA